MKTKICSKCKKLLSLSDFHNSKQTKNGLHSWCRFCNRERVAIYRKKHPWKRILYDIKRRCNNTNYKRYHQYGGRGIKCLITEEELKEIWFRDEAWLLNKPSIDRENNDGDYVYGNCRFIEMVENGVKDRRRPVIQYNLDDIFIKEWTSAKDASKSLKTDKSSITRCCRGKAKTAVGFKWRYKCNT